MWRPRARSSARRAARPAPATRARARRGARRRELAGRRARARRQPRSSCSTTPTACCRGHDAASRGRRHPRRRSSGCSPDVVITFDEDGLYWHPDHIAIHERTTAAVSACRDERAGLVLRHHPARAACAPSSTARGLPSRRTDASAVDPRALPTPMPLARWRRRQRSSSRRGRSPAEAGRDPMPPHRSSMDDALDLLTDDDARAAARVRSTSAARASARKATSSSTLHRAVHRLTHA